MKYNVVLNGPEDQLPDLKKYDGNRVLWVGADRGAMVIIKNNLKLYAALGDFDSVSDVELKLIEEVTQFFQRFPSEKDETDFQLILNWLLSKSDVDKINIFGWSGGRFDQFMSNISVITRKKYQAIADKIELTDKQNWVKLLNPGKWSITPQERMKFVSFYSVSPITDIEIKDFKYELCKDKLDANIALSSNEFINNKNGKISFASGQIIVSQSADSK